MVATAAAGAASTSKAASPVTLTVWDFQYLSSATAAVGTLTNVEKKLDQQFEASHPGIKIKHVGVPFATLQTKLQAAIAAKSGPDVVSWFPSGTGFARGMTPLEGLLSARQKKQIIGWRDSIAPTGHLLFVPFTLYAYIFEYNKKLVKQAGLNPNDPFNTWQELLTACQKLDAAGVKPISGGWQDGYYPEWFTQVFQGQVLTPAQRKKWSNWDLPFSAMRQAYVNVVALKNANCWGDTGSSETQQDAYTNFVGGKSAIFLGLATEFKELKKNLGANNVGVEVFPKAPGSKYPRYSDLGPLSGWGIPKYSKHQREAWEYISFLESPAAQQQIWKQAGVVPNVRGLTVTSKWAPQAAALRAMFTNPHNHTTATSWTVNMGQANERCLPQLLNDQISVDDCVDQISEVYAKDRAALKG